MREYIHLMLYPMFLYKLFRIQLIKIKILLVVQSSDEVILLKLCSLFNLVFFFNCIKNN